MWKSGANHSLKSVHLIHQHYGILTDIHILNFHPLCFQQRPRSAQGLVDQGLRAARIHHSPVCTPITPYCSPLCHSWTGGGCRRADDVEGLSCSLSYRRHCNILCLVVVPTCCLCFWCSFHFDTVPVCTGDIVTLTPPPRQVQVNQPHMALTPEPTPPPLPWTQATENTPPQY